MVKIGHPSISAAFEPPPLDLGVFRSTSKFGVIEEYFRGDWRSGQEIGKIVITQRFYQISPNSTQAWFWKSNFTIKRPKIFNKIYALEIFDSNCDRIIVDYYIFIILMLYLNWKVIYRKRSTSFLWWIYPGAKIFRKSYQSFLRIALNDEDSLKQKFLRPYNVSLPVKIVIRNDGYKRFRNITVQTKVGF